MANRPLTERVQDFVALRALKAAGKTLPFTPQYLAHVYVKIEFAPKYENAANADDAKGFLRSVARAATTAHLVAARYRGVVLEVQGSMLHIGLLDRRSTDAASQVKDFITDLHWAYRAVFDKRTGSRVTSWRMTADAGKTLVVAGRGVHGDDSYVSLGKAANRPAKYLYAQLELGEAASSLKRFHAGIRNVLTDKWQLVNLNATKPNLSDLPTMTKAARAAEPQLDFIRAANPNDVTARALPIDPAGTTSSPTAESPHTYYGWVMRADLDGFTARVEECFDNDRELQDLAGEFYSIMDAAAEFTARSRMVLVQFPWAGDNFTAAAVFETKDAHDAAASVQVVELTLDFEKELAEAAINGGFGGWAHGIAGGEVHGNLLGNVFLAGITIDDRRLLVGAGEGFGRSAQAFGDINPKAEVVVIYKDDWKRLEEHYKSVFDPATTCRGEQSALYRWAKVDRLNRARTRQASLGAETIITFPAGETRPIRTKPHTWS